MPKNKKIKIEDIALCYFQKALEISQEVSPTLSLLYNDFCRTQFNKHKDIMQGLIHEASFLEINRPDRDTFLSELHTFFRFFAAFKYLIPNTNINSFEKSMISFVDKGDIENETIVKDLVAQFKEKQKVIDTYVDYIKSISPSFDDQPSDYMFTKRIKVPDKYDIRDLPRFIDYLQKHKERVSSLEEFLIYELFYFFKCNFEKDNITSFDQLFLKKMNTYGSNQTLKRVAYKLNQRKELVYMYFEKATNHKLKPFYGMNALLINRLKHL